MASLRNRSWPFLFNIHISNLSSTTCRKYANANDLALLHSSRDWKGLEETLSQNMARISVHLRIWRLKLSHAKTMLMAFYLQNREAKHELKVYVNSKLLPFCPVLTKLRVKLDRSLMLYHHLEPLRKKLVTWVTFLR